MRYFKEKNIINYYMDSDSSADMGIINEVINNDIKLINNQTNSTVKKPESSDTDYYLSLLANKQKLNEDSDNNSNADSSVSEILESEKSDTSIESDSEDNSRKTDKSDNSSRSSRSSRSHRSNRSQKYSPKMPFNPAPFSGAQQKINTEKDDRMKKIELLRKLSELKTKGYDLSKPYDFNSSIEEMEYEYELLKSFANKRNGIKLFKSCLCNGISIIEMLNDKYDPFEFQLTGWSEHMSVEVDSYEEVLEELYEKYKGTGKSMPPEAKLVLLLVASASAFHFSKSTFKNLPGVDQAMKNNPDLVARMINPKKTPSQFQTQQEIHIQKQRELAIQRERAQRNQGSQNQMNKNVINPLQPTATRNEQPVLKAPDNVQDILKKLHGNNNSNLDSNLDSYVTNNSETQESSSNNDRIVASNSATTSERRKRNKKPIMTVL